MEVDEYGTERLHGRPFVHVEDGIRRQLARELHDGLAQTLTGLIIELETFKAEQAGRNSVIEYAGRFQERAREVLGSVRQLLLDLRGETSGDADVIAVLGRLLETFEKSLGLKCSVIADPTFEPRVPPARASVIRRLVEEALILAREEGAREAELLLSQLHGHCAVTLRWRARQAPASNESAATSLRFLRQQAALLGARLTIGTDTDGRVTVSAHIPVEKLRSTNESLEAVAR
jgi:signal transduction histidine kinase